MVRKTFLNPGSEYGYSLVSTIVAVAIMALLAAGIMTVIFQIYNVSSATTNHMVAIREVQNAGRWITRDTQAARIIETTGDSDGFPLTIKWYDQSGNRYEVVYDISMDNQLIRQHYTNRSINPDPDSSKLIARYINPSTTSCNISQNDELIVNISAYVDTRLHAKTETRVYRVFPRQSLF